MARCSLRTVFTSLFVDVVKKKNKIKTPYKSELMGYESVTNLII